MQVIYRPTVGSPVTVRGIFGLPYVLELGDAEAGVETRIPSVFLRLAGLPSDPMVDDPILTIGGTDYRVYERRPADFGSIMLGLRKVT